MWRLKFFFDTLKKGGNFKTRKFFKHPESFFYCLYSREFTEYLYATSPQSNLETHRALGIHRAHSTHRTHRNQRIERTETIGKLIL